MVAPASQDVLIDRSIQRILEFHFEVPAGQRNVCKQRFYCQVGIIMGIDVFHGCQDMRVFDIVFFCRLPQFDADRVDDNIESAFVFLFYLLMDKSADGVSASLYFELYGRDRRVGDITHQFIIVHTQ